MQSPHMRSNCPVWVARSSRKSCLSWWGCCFRGSCEGGRAEPSPRRSSQCQESPRLNNPAQAQVAAGYSISSERFSSRAVAGRPPNNREEAPYRQSATFWIRLATAAKQLRNHSLQSSQSPMPRPRCRVAAHNRIQFRNRPHPVETNPCRVVLQRQVATSSDRSLKSLARPSKRGALSP